MTAPAGSTATEAFAESARVVESARPVHAKRPPAFVFVPRGERPLPARRDDPAAYAPSDRDVLSTAQLRLGVR